MGRPIIIPGSPRRSRAFTLIELLVVIGIIAVLVGVLVGVLGGGNSSTALQSAQGTMSSLLASARGQAALTGRDAAVAVNFNVNNSDRYLRYCVVIVKDVNGNWVAANEGYYLPTGIYVVPPTSPTGNAVETGVSFGSIKSDGFDGTLTSQKFNSTASENWLVLGINSLGLRVDALNGTTPPTGGTYVVLSVATVQPPGTNPPMKFSNAQNVRGFSISQYGVAGFINDASGFN
ncbi:MAG TPA: prepilin-type N-terminal cleavage/methylation domain-containing protein [Rariglobus sp.]|jgi:prepilin-type N-terminal cleavage/methylation domain-containing protein|nr:prepilin-type N-terminal cleavage/methylation domain-containing protein [Rariglobus sp.]